MRKTILLAVLLALAAFGASAEPYSDTYVIPIVGHVMGANGTMWMSDVTIRNFSNTPMTVQAVLIESGDNTSNNIFPLVANGIDGSITVGANSTVMLRDILNGYAMQNVTGALLLGSDRPFAVTSRAYSSRSPLGQTVPAASRFFENTFGTADNNAVVYVPGVMNNASTRTNIGFVAGSENGMNVEITFRNGTGGVAGTRSFFVPGGSFMHMQIPARSFVNSNVDIGTVEFRITDGSGTIVPYASLVDNNTGDATYLMGQFPDSTNTHFSIMPSLFRGLLQQRSNIR
ncbi:MAG: hypothetical protein M3Q69_15015 [Acidobacteriota bacterium]|nr:hypothetical protein [Acidobacteriota bacterium]